MAGMQTASGDYIDSSWELRVFVGEEDPEAEAVTLRVTGESHIGGVLLKIVEQISECPPPPSPESQGLRHPPNLSAPRHFLNFPCFPRLHRSGVCRGPRAWSIRHSQGTRGRPAARGDPGAGSARQAGPALVHGPCPHRKLHSGLWYLSEGETQALGQGREGWHHRPGRVAGSR